ncbi:hypothetical protein DERP_015026 [Dermatophagoides pteronyssinus]|uniref:Uncharacterized protein n=1 Tax=Dermatophagoides pteronyssinus TaxID=6956 RepID=A0ABQ8JCV4_DERPT|nr:hypothetical protein DERP_015026 [Dermatophagoides pteronyssinus]
MMNNNSSEIKQTEITTTTTTIDDFHSVFILRLNSDEFYSRITSYDTYNNNCDKIAFNHRNLHWSSVWLSPSILFQQIYVPTFTFNNNKHSKFIYMESTEKNGILIYSFIDNNIVNDNSLLRLCSNSSLSSSFFDHPSTFRVYLHNNNDNKNQMMTTNNNSLMMLNKIITSKANTGIMDDKMIIVIPLKTLKPNDLLVDKDHHQMEQRINNNNNNDDDYRFLSLFKFDDKQNRFHKQQEQGYTLASFRIELKRSRKNDEKLNKVSV